jgi:hypothetical protein
MMAINSLFIGGSFFLKLSSRGLTGGPFHLIYFLILNEVLLVSKKIFMAAKYTPPAMAMAAAKSRIPEISMDFRPINIISATQANTKASNNVPGNIRNNPRFPAARAIINIRAHADKAVPSATDKNPMNG